MVLPVEILLLKELLKTEVDEFRIKWDTYQFLSKQGSFTSILRSTKDKSMKELAPQVDALSHVSDQELTLAFARAKRAIIESKKWLELNLVAYEKAYPNSPLDGANEKLYRELLQDFDISLSKVDLFLPKVLSLRHLRRPPDFFAQAMKAYDEIVPFFEKKTEDKKAIKEFLDIKRSYLKAICEYVEQHFSSWQKLSLEEGRGLYISVPSLFPFPLVYSTKGFLYIMMEIIGMYQGSGMGKISTRCIELTEGMVYALIKPRIESLEEPNEESKKNKVRWTFRSTWQESEMMLALRGCRGIIQLQDRLAFLIDNQRHLYLIEQLYPDGTLDAHLEAVIQKQKNVRFSVALKLRLAQSLLSGLKSIHEKHIIHHDVKANNIFLSLIPGKEEAVIADFNISFFEDDLEGKKYALSTFFWCPPEEAYFFLHPKASLEEVLAGTTNAGDVWSLGLTFYMLFNYRTLPWHQLENIPARETIVGLKDDWLPSYPDIAFIYPLLNKMLQPNPKKRCTAKEALAIFEHICKELETDDLP
jgi:serine/threonine protein kinase